MFKFYGVGLKETEKQWFAADGKELRGSIEKGDTRGEVPGVCLVGPSAARQWGACFGKGGGQFVAVR